MFFFGKDKKKPDKTPKWFMWLMGAFVVYALLTSLFTDKVPVARQEQEVAKITSDGKRINFTVVKGQSVGGPALPLYVTEIEQGRGTERASCWHSVGVRYRLYNGNHEKVGDTETAEEPERFTIGRGEVIPALERGVIGMRKGGSREITARPELGYGQNGFSHPVLRKGDFVGYILTLEELSRPDNLPHSDLGLRIYDDKVGDGLTAQCTDDVRVKLRGYDLKGRPLWGVRDFPAMIVRLGAGEAPYAVERALMGMKTGGKRTLVVPVGYMKPLFAEVDAAEDAGKDVAEDAIPAEAEADAAEEDATAAMARELAEDDRLAQQPPAAKYQWADLPIPQDEVIILEVELLPLEIELPDL